MTATFWRIRYNDWKVVLMEQRAKQLACWFEPFVKLRAPKMFNLRRDPFERADENSNTYWDWVITHAYLIYGMQAIVAQQIEEFVKFPPRQKAGLVQSGRGAGAACRTPPAVPTTDLPPRHRLRRRKGEYAPRGQLKAPRGASLMP